MIEYWINYIMREDFGPFMYNHVDPKPRTVWTFVGDGEGDFEERDEDASEKVIKDYIKECEKQIQWAKEYLDGR